MRGTIGFRSFIPVFFLELLKRDALMFRKVGVLGCTKILDEVKNLPAEVSTELRWLIDQGIVFDLPISPIITEDDLEDAETVKLVVDWIKLSERYEGKVEQYAQKLEKKLARELIIDGHKVDVRGELVNSLVSSELYLRPLTAHYRNNENMDVYPLFYNGYPELTQQTSSVGDVIDLTINQLPIPDDSTSWEQIMEFRNDPATEGKFLDLRNWMNEIARAKLTPLEVEQKLEWLVHEYQRHMELHRMKINVSALETILVSIADRKFGDIVKGLFSVRHRKIALLEGELKAPGREIAFISKAQETFR